MFTIMIGPPGAGKSSVVAGWKQAFPELRVFSSDEYRSRLLGDERDQTQNALIFSTLYRDLNDALKEGCSCVLDATNMSLKDRDRVFQQLPALREYNDPVVACVVATPYEECVRRDAARDRTVGEAVIRKMIGRFQFPDMRLEDFDAIEVIEGDSLGAQRRVQWMAKMVGFDQQNHHHKHTLLEHSVLVAGLGSTEAEQHAGFWHDVGKLVTQTFDENGEAHYYNHAGFSAWMLASSGAFTYA